MPFIYKPIKQYMTPNENTINPKSINEFSCIISGQSCVAYRFLIYDMQNNLISGASVLNKTNTEKRYNISDIEVTKNNFMISSNELKNGDAIKFVSDGVLPTPLKTSTTYYVGDFKNGRFKIYLTREDGLNSSVPDYRASVVSVDIEDVGQGNHSVIYPTNLYNGDTLSIFLDKNKLIAGNTYKWQVELFANNLSVNSVNTSQHTVNITNHNLVTGDTVYVFGDSLPSPLVQYKTYYIRNIDTNNIALFDNIEGARNDAGRISISTVGSNVVISNVAISEQSVFSVYDEPTLTLESKTINQQSYTFKPIYNHPQGVMVNSFIAYIRPDNNIDEVVDSGMKENVKIEHTFDGLLGEHTYYVKFVAYTKSNQKCSTPWVAFPVDYEIPKFGVSPTIANNEKNSSVVIRWSGIKQIIGDINGENEFVDDFVNKGNVGLHLNPLSYLKYTGLDVRAGSSPPMFWWKPESKNFTGVIMRCENSKNGRFIEIGYNGTTFYKNIDGVIVNNAAFEITPEHVYMIGLTYEDLIINVI